MPAIQNLSMYTSEDRTFTLYARDASNAPLSLTGATVQWRLGRGPYNLDLSWPLVTKSGAITDSAHGVFTASIAAADTTLLQGDFRHESWVSISGQSYLVNEGRLRIQSYISGGT